MFLDTELFPKRPPRSTFPQTGERPTLVNVTDGTTLPGPGADSLFERRVIQLALISLLTKECLGLKFGWMQAIAECATAGAFLCHFRIQRSA